MLNYDEIDVEMKTLLKKTMDIYAVLQNRIIEKNVNSLSGEEAYIYSQTDKKVLSLFTACFLAEGRLRKNLEKYDDIRVEDLFSFISIKEEELVPLAEEEYKKMYVEKIYPELRLMLEAKERKYHVKNFTTEILYSSLEKVDIGPICSEILNYFASSCGLEYHFIHSHPSFKEMAKNAFLSGDLEEKVVSKGDGFGSVAFILGGLDSKREFGQRDKEKEDFDGPSSNGEDACEEKTVDLDSDEIWDILEEIQAKFIGQEEACEYLFYNIINNQQLARREDVQDGERSIIFIDGPTGTGKTAITREITEKLGIPFVSTSATNYSGTGYVGGDITDVLIDLLKKANGNIEKAQKGIVVFDEFDKIAYGRMGGLEMKRAVQQQLLDFLGGGKYKVPIRLGIFGGTEMEFDTSKLTFVCLGALTETRDGKMENKASIGFGGTESQEKHEYSITPQDLIDIGLERELVGRFNTYLHTKEYSKEDLLRILNVSTISPMLGFKKWIESKGKKLVVDDGVYEAIVDDAYELNTGARSLQTVMNNIRTPLIKSVLRGQEEMIVLSAEMVRDIDRNVKTRKVLRK